MRRPPIPVVADRVMEYKRVVSWPIFLVLDINLLVFKFGGKLARNDPGAFLWFAHVAGWVEHICFRALDWLINR